MLNQKSRFLCVPFQNYFFGRLLVFLCVLGLLFLFVLFSFLLVGPDSSFSVWHLGVFLHCLFSIDLISSTIFTTLFIPTRLVSGFQGHGKKVRALFRLWCDVHPNMFYLASVRLKGFCKPCCCRESAGCYGVLGSLPALLRDASLPPDWFTEARPSPCGYQTSLPWGSQILWDWGRGEWTYTRGYKVG